MSTLAVNTITNAAGGNTAQINGMTPTAQSLQGFRNRLINSDMRIDQRNAGASVSVVSPGTPAYAVDRFFVSGSQTGKLTAQRNAGAVTPPTGFTNYFGVTSSSAYTVGASEAFYVRQHIEGFNTADLMFGTANAQAITVSFWVRSSLTGSFGANIANSAFNRSYPFSYTISAANTWEQKSVTIPGDATGTWLTDNGTGFILTFGLGYGASLSGTANAWNAGTAFMPTGAVSVVGTSGATFYITGVQLEAGSVATPFEQIDYGRELAMCQRYYEIGSIFQIYSGYVVSGDVYYNPVRFAVNKRATPTVVSGATNGVSLFVQRFPTTALSASQMNLDGFYTQATATSTGTGYYQYSWTASAEL